MPIIEMGLHGNAKTKPWEKFITVHHARKITIYTCKATYMKFISQAIKTVTTCKGLLNKITGAVDHFVGKWSKLKKK